VHGVGLDKIPACCPPRRLYRRQGGQSDLQASLGRRHRPYRGGEDRLRSAKVSYSTLVSRFFRTVDPLDSGGQFCDRGYQYRSAIFVADAEQRRIASARAANVSARLKKPVATLLLPTATFYPAEAYHQDYYKKNPVRYRFYRTTCGRDARLKAVWARASGLSAPQKAAGPRRTGGCIQAAIASVAPGVTQPSSNRGTHR
jgi:hypothetical protein